MVIPVAMQHFTLLERNLIYTGTTRARQFLVVIGQKKALGMAVMNDQSRKRYRNRPAIQPPFWLENEPSAKNGGAPIAARCRTLKASNSEASCI